MKKSDFAKLLNKQTIILDGATGTLLHESGMPAGKSPELYTLSNKSELKKIQMNYFEAGADIVYAFTFGANRLKLAHYGIPSDDIAKINFELAQISCEARDEMIRKCPGRIFLVAGDLAPTGSFLSPAGDLTFDELVDIYKEQVTAMEEAGVDLYAVETMMDLAQARAAVIAIREICDKPIIATMTFSGGRTLSGNTPMSCLVTLAALGIDAFGANCSTGPSEMKPLLAEIAPLSPIPLVAKPNAGMPRRIEGKTIFPMDPIEFGKSMKEIALEGMSILGGCCGTTPKHIEQMVKNLDENEEADQYMRDRVSRQGLANKFEYLISSYCNTVLIEPSSIKYDIHCMDSSDLGSMISDAAQNEPDYIAIDLTECAQALAGQYEDIIDATEMAGMSCKVPLSIITGDTDLLERIARAYTGRLMLINRFSNSDILNVCKKYGILII